VALVVRSKWRIVLFGREGKRSATPPASHQLRCNQLLAFSCWSTMLAEKVAKRANMLLQPAISHEGAISRKGFRLRQRNQFATLVDMPENELSCLDRRAGAGRRLDSASFDLRLREPVPITEMIVSVVKRWKAVQIK